MSTTSPTPSTPEQDPRVARSRTKMLAAATELLVEGGPRGVTVDAVAERSGVAKSTLYRHWSSVNELLIDVMRANVPAAMLVDLDAGFVTALHSWVDQAVATLSAPDWARVLTALLELRTHAPEMADLLAADFENKLATVSSILELGVAEGRLPVGLDPRFVTHTLIGPLVLAALSGDEDVAALAEYVVGRFLASYPTPQGGLR
ncbi:MAG: TetR/AcrR family transcriptional regulator [Acidimicrobiales bacterium]|nr:TetR/AcrR family transcriptional regulator [Acidimicrobiales bacterium]